MNKTLTLIPPFSIIWPFNQKLIFRIFWTFCLLSILALSIIYILQVNHLAREVFLIKSSEEKLNQLLKNNEKLEINFAQSNSLENIENYLQNQNFEKVSQVKYIRILESPVVKKDHIR